MGSYGAFDDLVRQVFESKTDIKSKNLQQRFNQLHLTKTSIMTRCVDYATWTLPGMFPRIGLTQNIEYQQSVESLGARGVNHLSNKLVLTLFQPSTPFFRIRIASKEAILLQKMADSGDQQALTVLKNMDTVLAEAEQEAMSKLDYNRYRTEATTACKQLIITGNALLYHPEGTKERVHVYSLRDYCVLRDLSGEPIEIITRDNKAFCTFHDDVKNQLRVSAKDKYEDDTDVTIYTRVRLEDDGKWHLQQAADIVNLDSEGVWTTEELPWIVLSWNLLRGENYGRGLVEDYAGAFHALQILTNAVIRSVAQAADLKIGVDPASVVDVTELNKAQPGSYHTCKKDDIFPLVTTNSVDLQQAFQMIERLEKQITTAFLLNSAVQRDAERVTAEEIKYVAQELETAYGGIYSRFAEEWQLKEATLLLKRIHVNLGKDIYPQIITGLDSLSNAGEMNNMELFLHDLSMLAGIPPEMLQAIDPMAYAVFCAVRRGVEYKKILKTPQQMQQDQQQAQQQQAQQAQSQAGASVADAAGKQAIQGQ